MSKGILKTASGTILKNSSPAAIEEYLVRNIQEALGPWKNAVKVKPYLRVDEEDSDLSNNVKNGFGAIELNAYGVKLYIPFIIADKTLLPFDTIRMGEQEISYDYSKLRRVINAIEHKKKTAEESGGNSDQEFPTMEVASFDDIQYNNGFLGTIMQIRDNHRMQDGNAYDKYKGSGFGTVDEERMQSYAAENMDILYGFHQVMEKIATVRPFTQKQLDVYEQHLIKTAEKEEMEQFEKLAADNQETMEAAKIKRDMMKLEDEKLFNVHRAASGNNIAFPIHDGNRVEFRTGRVYRQFESWFKNTPSYNSNRLGAVVLDTKGGYNILKSNQPFMASTKEPDSVDLPTTQAKSLQIGPLYLLEKDSSTLYNPFIVERSWLHDVLNDGMVISYREGLSNPLAGSRTINSLITEVLECKEVAPGRRSNTFSLGFGNERFSIVVTKDPEVTAPTPLSYDEVLQYIMEKANDPQDAALAREMLFYTKDCILVPERFSFFKAEKNIKGFYTQPDGLFKEGPLSKTAAYDSQNKATLIVKNDRNPKTYAVKWAFTKKNVGEDGVESTKLEKRYQEGLSKQQAQTLLGSLGFDYRTQARFFEITARNGRSASFTIPDKKQAEQTSPTDKAESKAKQKMKNLANSMLSSRNFMPVMGDVIAGGITDVVSSTVPGSITAAHNVGDFLGIKQAEEVAIEIEKIATQLNGPEWHELSALLNMKHRLDKIAQRVMDGEFLYKGADVFEKVAEFKPVIEKKASELIDFNRKQLLNTSSYLVKPSLVKEAVNQLDGLYVYANAHPPKKENKRLVKQAGLFNFKGSRKEMGRLDGLVSEARSDLNNAKEHFSDRHAELRALLGTNADEETVQRAISNARDAESQYKSSLESLQSASQAKGDAVIKKAKQNIGVGAAVGLPGLAGLSYLHTQAKEKRK